VSFRLILAVGLAIGLPALLPAQINNRQLQRQQQQGAMQQPVAIRGRIQNAAKGVIVVLANNNQMCKVAILPLTKIHVTGTMTAKSLYVGLVVDFVAEIDDQGAILGKVDALTVTSLTRDKQLGFFPPGDAKEKEGEVVDGFAPTVEKDKKDPGDTGGKHVKRPPRTAGKASTHTPAGKYRIIGQLLVGHNGALSVQTRRGASQLSLELADQAKIDVDMSDFSLVSRGNEVSVKGFAVPGRPGMMQAAEVRVKLPEPQTDDQQEPAGRPEAKKSPKHAKKAKDKDDSEQGADPAADRPAKKAKGKDGPMPEPGGDQ
jgi:hypothetical protein